MGRILLLVAICFVCNHARSDDSIKVQPRDVFDDAEAFLVMLNSSVASATELYLPALRRLPRELEAKSIAVMVPARTEIDSIYKHLVKQVTDLEERFDALGVDISACTSFYKPQIDELPRDVLGEIERCLRQSVLLGDQFVERSVEEIRGAPSVIARLQLRLDECRILPGTFDCANRVLEDIALQVIDLPASMKEDHDRATVVVKALEEQFPECYSDRVESVEAVGTSLYYYLELCAVKT